MTTPQKHLSGRAGIVAGGGEQNGIAQGGHVLAAADQPHRDGDTFQGLAGPPAAGPDGCGRTRSSSDFNAIPAAKAAARSSGARPRGRVQPGKAAGNTGEATRGVTGESMAAIL